VGNGLGDSAGLGEGLSAITVGMAVAGAALGDGGLAARDPREAPIAQPLKNRIKRARPASRPILEG